MGKHLLQKQDRRIDHDEPCEKQPVAEFIVVEDDDAYKALGAELMEAGVEIIDMEEAKRRYFLRRGIVPNNT